jgi:hypothetical protein
MAGGFAIAEREGLDDSRWDRVVVRSGRGLGGRVIDGAHPISVADDLGSRRSPRITGPS